MNKLLIPKILHNIDCTDFNTVSDYLQNQTPQRINIVNWKKYPYRPEVSFRMMYNDFAFYIRFDVKENYVRARATRNNSQVCLDSCLELFISPENNDEYYNLEMNCIGAKLFKCRKVEMSPELASDEVISTIRCRSSLGNLPFEEKKGEITWNMVVIIPFEAFWKHRIKPVKGLKIRGNLYKCGDELSEPHYLSWNKIDTESPNFHKPRFFGEFELG